MCFKNLLGIADKEVSIHLHLPYFIHSRPLTFALLKKAVWLVLKFATQISSAEIRDVTTLLFLFNLKLIFIFIFIKFKSEFQNQNQNQIQIQIQKQNMHGNYDAKNSRHKHLIVLVHGLWGTPKHMASIKRILSETSESLGSQGLVYILNSEINSGFKTFDGVEVCGERLFLEILTLIRTKALENVFFGEISIIGYSFGGLASRYCIGLMYEAGFFNTIKPILFNTFATPHLGTYFYKETVFDRFKTKAGSTLIGQSGRDLFGYKSDIIYEMCQLDSRYIKGLKLFEHRIVLANTQHDRTVAFFSAYITDSNPWDDHSKVKVKYREQNGDNDDDDDDDDDNNIINMKLKTGSVPIIDLDSSRFLSDMEIKNIKKNKSKFNPKKIAIISLVIVLMPLWVTFALVVNIYGTSASWIRRSNYKSIKSPYQKWMAIEHDIEDLTSDNSNENTKASARKSLEYKTTLHRKSTGASRTARMGGNLLENVLQFDDDSDQIVDSSSSTRNTSSAESNDEDDEDKPKLYTGHRTIDESTNLSVLPSRRPKIHKRTTFFGEASLETFNNYNILKESKIIEFRPKYKEMVLNLNSLEWEKYAVCFHEMNAHAEIVARRGKGAKTGSATLKAWSNYIFKGANVLNIEQV